jgi:hypothetical protein
MKMRIVIVLLAFSMSLNMHITKAATYQLTYSSEIFNYCVKKYGTEDDDAADCMASEKKRKDKIISNAKRKLGRLSLAEQFYAECVNYYRPDGVKRIGKCVDTRLVLRKKLGDDAVEKQIYKKCDLKWGNHGFRAIENCSTTESTYYRNNGKLKD